MSAGGEPITKCPVCRYDLTGLPRNHRCPECGFEYDETMRVWYARAPSRSHLILSLMTSLAMGSFPFVMIARAWLLQGTPPVVTLRTLAMVLLAILTAFLLATVTILPHLRPVFLIVADDGLYMRALFGRLRRFSWQDISVRGLLSERGHAAEEDGSPSTLGRLKAIVRRRLLAGTSFDFRIVRNQAMWWQGSTVRLPFMPQGVARRREIHEAIYQRWRRARERVGVA